MTPAARLQATIEILEQLDASRLPADRFIRDWFRMRRYAGSKDRAAVADRVFAVLRHRTSLGWRMRDATPRALVIASVLADGADAAGIESLFGTAGYGPSPLTPSEREAIANPPQGEPPLHVQGEYPEFLQHDLEEALGGTLLDEMRALQSRAPVDLRVNTLKASRGDVLAKLREQGFTAEPTPYSPVGIRIPSGDKLAQLRQSELFEGGAYEFQDEAAQMASLLAHARPGERILDLAAGAGGKALALAAEMKNQGAIVACDIDSGRLAQIGPRAERAGVTIIETHAGEPPEGAFDAVFVDAPCSGTGTWRRQPELRWRLTEDRLGELHRIQDSLLDKASAHVRPGGRIVYATCSLLVSENESRIAHFLAHHSRYALLPAAEIWREIGQETAPPGMGDLFRATPLSTGTDGFFVCVLGRSPAA